MVTEVVKTDAASQPDLECYNHIMPNYYQQLKIRIERRQHQRLVECVHLWYQTSVEVCELCGKALDDSLPIQDDIGVLLDRADRKLFQYRNDASDARRAIRRIDPVLSNRVETITEQVYELRNQTASFLIRSQGPGPFGAAREESSEKDAYYRRAMGDSGMKARSLKANLDREIESLWQDIEGLVSAADNRT